MSYPHIQMTPIVRCAHDISDLHEVVKDVRDPEGRPPTWIDRIPDAAHFRMELHLWGEAQSGYRDFADELLAEGLLHLPAPLCVFTGRDVDDAPFALVATPGAQGFDIMLVIREAGIWRCPDSERQAEINGPAEDIAWRFLLIILGALMTRGVELREVRPASLPRNASRAERRAYERAPKVSPYTVVRLSERLVGAGGREGNHSTKRPHFRRGHVRRLASRQRTVVRPSWINAADDVRAAYRVRH